MDSSSDTLPTSQIEQLLNSTKINSVTNPDYIKPESQENNNVSSLSDKDFLKDFVQNTKNNEKDNDFDFLDNEKANKDEEVKQDPNNGITTEINNILDIKDNEAREYKNNSDENKKMSLNDGNINPFNQELLQNDNYDSEIDEYESLSKNKKKLARMDMLRKLADLKKKGYLISDEYNIDSDYYAMKEEYEYQMSIKGKDGFVKNTFCYGLSLIKMLEFANKKYDPFGIDLDGWNSNIESSKEEILDVISDIYEKYHRPGSGTMAPELRLLIILVSSAASTVIANSGAKMLASMFKNEPVIKEEEKTDILKNLNIQINNQPNIKDEKINVVSNDFNRVKEEIKNRDYSIPQPELPESLKDTKNSLNVFDNLIKNQKKSKKMF